MTQPKTYVLLDALDNNAPIYQQVPGNKRVQLKKMPFYPLYLQITITTEDGKNKTMRYKGNAASIWQNEQIKDGILANERYTSSERAEMQFRNGILVTNKPLAQEYLNNYPGNINFKGSCDAIATPFFKELDATVESKIANAEFKKRLKAANKIAELELEDAQEMLIRLNGSFFVTPATIEECQNLLMDFLDDSEDEGIELILKGDDSLNIDESTSIMIGKLINQGTLSFTEVEGKISKLSKDGKWVAVREIGTDISMDEKLRLFSNFLNTTDGKALKNDLEADLPEVDEDEDGIEVKSAKRKGRPPSKKV